MIQFNQLPKTKPAVASNITNGRYTATVHSCDMRKKDDNSSEYLNVSFLLDGGGFVNENYFDSDKQFPLYKLSRLLIACNTPLEGEGSLKDIAKVIKGKRVVVDVVINDKGYPSLDYTGANDGIYPVGDTSVIEAAEDIDPEIAAAITEDPEF